MPNKDKQLLQKKQKREEIRPVVLNLFDLVAYPRPIKKRTGALCMESQNINMLN